MKSMFTLLLSCLCFISFGKQATYEKLSEVNKCWRAQTDVSKDLPAPAQAMNEHSWIQYHLTLVEQTLRNRTTANLTAQQASNRAKCLDYLNDYWHAGNFPINEDYAIRTPIFIDKHDNFCAVGYLVKASGHEEVSCMISSKTNLAYVKEMNYPELNAWASDNGFTIDELAWIQPGYPPAQYSASVGKGVDGEVKELFADDADGKLYVGGSFVTVDSTITANNIAYVTESGGVYTWHNMGRGVNGSVHAIAKVNGKIFVAGNFTMAGDSAANNIAWWDGVTWHGAGCIYGTINDLAVMKGELYAVGEFDICAALMLVNLAKWDGTYWHQMPLVNGKVNTVHVMDTTLILGGSFSYGGNALNVIKWSENALYQPFATNIANEVKDFEMFKDTLYAVCKKTSTVDTVNLMVRLINNSWTTIRNNSQLYSFTPNGSPLSFNTLCTDGDQLMLGGSFVYLPVIGIFAANCMDVSPSRQGPGDWFTVDSGINKMVVFKNNLFAGGVFKKGYGPGPGGPWAPTTIAVNGIARRYIAPSSVPTVNPANTFELYPNPVASSSQLTIKNNFNASQYIIRDLAGKTIAEGSLKTLATQSLNMPALSSGMYLIELLNAKNEKAVKRFMVR